MNHSPPQFTRNADGFFLEVEYLQQSINFLLVSHNESLFYELKLTNSNIPPQMKNLLPTIKHIYVYLLKNYQHPRAFRIDSQAHIHIAVPVPNDLPVEIVLPTKNISNENLMPEDELIFAGEDQVQEIKSAPKNTMQVEDFFPKKRTGSSDKLCLDLQNTDQTPRSAEVSAISAIPKTPQKNIKQRDEQICRKIEQLLGQGWQMRMIRSKFKLGDKTAFKMFQQYQRFRRIFTPAQGRMLKQNESAARIIRNILQVNHGMNVSALQQQLLRRGIRRQISFLNKCLSRTQVVYYSDESGSLVSDSQPK